MSSHSSGGAGEDQGDDRADEGSFRPPLPPEDRLWRHPSEVAMERAQLVAAGRGRRIRLVTAGMIAATLTLALAAVFTDGSRQPGQEAAAGRIATDAGWLGLRGTDMPADDPTFRGVRELSGRSGAATVVDVVEGGPADAAGIERGDVVLGIDDTEISSMAELVEAVRAHHTGDRVTVWIWREGARHGMDAVLASRPES